MLLSIKNKMPSLDVFGIWVRYSICSSVFGQNPQLLVQASFWIWVSKGVSPVWKDRQRISFREFQLRQFVRAPQHI